MAAPLAASGPMTGRRAAGSGLDVVQLAVGFIWLRGPAPPPLGARSVRGRPPLSPLPRPPPPSPRLLSAPLPLPPAAGSRARARGDHVLTEGRGRRRQQRGGRRRGGRRRGAGLGSLPRAAPGVAAAVAAAGRRASDREEEQELEEEPPPPPPGNRAPGGRPAAGPSRPRRGLPGPSLPDGAQAAGLPGGPPAPPEAASQAGRGEGARPGPAVLPSWAFQVRGQARGCGRVGPPACLPTIDQPRWLDAPPARPPLFRQIPPPPNFFSCHLRADEWDFAPILQ